MDGINKINKNNVSTGRTKYNIQLEFVDCDSKRPH